jgi:hypothetical protein
MGKLCGAQAFWNQVGMLAQPVAGAFDGYGRNAKLVFGAVLKVEAHSISLYRHPKHRRSPRRSEKVSII